MEGNEIESTCPLKIVLSSIHNITPTSETHNNESKQQSKGEETRK